MTWRTLVLVALWVVPARWPRHLRLAGCMALWSPVGGVLSLCCAAVITRMGRIRRERTRGAAADREVVVLGELVALGLSAGSGFVTALDDARKELVTSLADEVTSVVRSMRRDGAEMTLAGMPGRASGLYALAGRAMVTGAPLLEVVEQFIDEARSREREGSLAAVRRLPVVMMFPLALLILPGFVVLTVAPGVVAAVERFTS